MAGGEVAGFQWQVHVHVLQGGWQGGQVLVGLDINLQQQQQQQHAGGCHSHAVCLQGSLGALPTCVPPGGMMKEL